jgi:hypothetical protein
MSEEAMTEKRRECLCEDKVHHRDRLAKHVEAVQSAPEDIRYDVQCWVMDEWDRAWDGLERCDMCGEELAHDYVHWNGAFAQCENCSVLESLDPDQNGLDPIFGGTFSQGMRPVYGMEER